MRLCRGLVGLVSCVAVVLSSQLAHAATWTYWTPTSPMPQVAYASCQPAYPGGDGCNLQTANNLVTLAPHPTNSEMSVLTEQHRTTGQTIDYGNNLDNYDGTSWATRSGIYFHGIFLDGGGTLWGYTEQSGFESCTSGYCELWSASSDTGTFTQVTGTSLPYVTSFAADYSSSPNWYAIGGFSSACGGASGIPAGQCGATCQGGSGCTWSVNSGSSEWGGDMVTVDRTNGDTVGSQYYGDLYVLDDAGHPWWFKPSTSTWHAMSYQICDTSSAPQYIRAAEIAAKNGILYADVPSLNTGGYCVNTDCSGEVYYNMYRYNGEDCFVSTGASDSAVSIATGASTNTAHGVWMSDSSGGIAYIAQPTFLGCPLGCP